MTTTTLTTQNNLRAAVAELADTYMTAKPGTLANKVVRPIRQSGASTFGMLSDSFIGQIELDLDADGAVTFSVNTFPDREAFYSTVLLAEDATFERVAAHAEKGVRQVREHMHRRQGAQAARLGEALGR